MKVILSEQNQYVLRFERGEEVIEALKQFCRSENIQAGFFRALGACDYVKLASYDIVEKKYHEREFDQPMEIANLVGDVSMADGNLMIHMHGTFSNEELQAFAGHVMTLKISVTCEMVLQKFDKKINRKFDETTGLKLLE